MASLLASSPPTTRFPRSHLQGRVRETPAETKARAMQGAHGRSQKGLAHQGNQSRGALEVKAAVQVKAGGCYGSTRFYHPAVSPQSPPK